jgi:asparagine N-glycosylation enzyme membrane subunit Stt3
MAREATRFVYLIQFALCILAAFGLETLLEAHLEPQRWSTVLVIAKWAAISATALLCASILVQHLGLNPWIALSLFFIVCSCGLIAIFVKRQPSRALLFGIACFVLLDIGFILLGTSRQN